MANRVTELVTRLIAHDDASKIIEHVADDLDALEKRKDVEVGVKVDDKASDQVRELDRRLDGLSDEDKTIVLKAQAKDAQREVDRLVRSLKDVDKLDDEEVKIRVDALGDAKRELKAIEDQAERLDREKVDVEVDADTTGATSALSRIRTDFNNASGIMGKSSALVGGAVTAISNYGPQTAAAAAAAVGLFVRSAVTDFQTLALEVGKMRDSLGIPAEEASRLKEVVEDLGIPIEAFQTAIGRMNKAAELTPGAFSGIGAEVVRSKDGVLDVTETFLSAATALDGMQDAGARNAAGQKIFGRGWLQLAELVEQGGLTIREAMDEVLEGKLVGDEDVQNARDMRDAVDELRDSYEGFANQVGSELIPVITKLVDGLELLGDGFSLLQGDLPGPAIIDNTLGQLVRHINPITGAMNTLSDGIGLAKSAWGGLFGDKPTEAEAAAQAVSDINVQLEALAAQKDPLSVMADQWKILMDDIRDGTIDTKAGADAAELLAGALGKTTEEVLAIADVEIDKEFEAAQAAAENAKTALEGVRAEAVAIVAEAERVHDEIAKWETSADEAAIALADAMAPLEDGTAAADAFATALDEIGRGKGLETLQSFGDTEEAIKGVFSVVKENKGVIPDIFDVGKQSSRDMTDALAALADTYETDLLGVIQETGGNLRAARDRADELRASLTERFAAKFDLDLADEDDAATVAALVDSVLPTDAEVQVAVKLSRESLLKLKADLALEQLSTLLPETALQLKVDMAEGEISPRDAVATAQAIFDEAGSEVDLGVNTDKANDELVLFARTERTTSMGLVVTPDSLSGAAAAIDAGPGGQGWPPISVPVEPILTGFPGSHRQAGGRVGPRGEIALVGEKGPEIVALPGGAHVYSAAQTRALAAGTGASLATAAAAVHYHVNVALNAAVIGGSFDVMRAVESTLRQAGRLMPRNP